MTPSTKKVIRGPGARKNAGGKGTLRSIAKWLRDQFQKHRALIIGGVYSAIAASVLTFATTECSRRFSKPEIQVRIFNTALEFSELQWIETDHHEMGEPGNIRIHLLNNGNCALIDPKLELTFLDPTKILAAGKMYEIAYDKMNKKSILTIAPGDIPPFQTRSGKSEEYKRIGELFRFSVLDSSRMDEVKFRLKVSAQNYPTLTTAVLLKVARQ